MTNNQDLGFRQLRRTNAERCGRWHEDKPWNGSDWSNAMAGEFGEAMEVLEAIVLSTTVTASLGAAANTVKKIRRGEDGHPGAKDFPISDLIYRLSVELADTVIYLDLLADRFDIDLASAVTSKFNMVSRREGFPETLPPVSVRERSE